MVNYLANNFALLQAEKFPFGGFPASYKKPRLKREADKDLNPI